MNYVGCKNDFNCSLYDFLEIKENEFSQIEIYILLEKKLDAITYKNDYIIEKK